MTTAVQSTETSLPPLSKTERQIYNHMAEHMDYFHNHFRHEWSILYKAASTGKRPQGMSVRQLIQAGEQFCAQLTMHHTIEERSIFPILAQKMPAFREELEMLEHHKKIHAGIDKMEAFFREVKSGEKDYSAYELKAVMDSFGSILFEHLDEEVRQLSADNMRKYWTLQEMKQLPM